jgi:hypothetical protein
MYEMVKFIENVGNLRVLTPNGYVDFDGLQIKDSSKLLKFIFEDGTEIKTTPDHKFGDRPAAELFPDDEVEAEEGFKTIFEIVELNGDFEVGDLLNVSGSVYYTNGVLSHNCSFEKSGNTVLDPDTIEWYEKHTIQEPVIKEAFDRNLWIWQHPEYGKSYIVSADVARGDGSDYSTAIVSCIDTMEQVAEYRGKLPPSQFGELLVQIGKRYNDAMIICENNSIGYAAIQKVLDCMYPKIYWSKKTEGEMFFDPLNWHLPGPDKIPGFSTTGKNRPLLISNWEEMLRTKTYIIRSSRLLDEIKGFIWVNTGNNLRAQAAERMHDDLVLACAIGLFARNTTLRLTSRDNSQVNALLDSISIESGRHSISAFSIQQETSGQDLKRNPFIVGDEDLSWVARE